MSKFVVDSVLAHEYFVLTLVIELRLVNKW